MAWNGEYEAYFNDNRKLIATKDSISCIHITVICIGSIHLWFETYVYTAAENPEHVGLPGDCIETYKYPALSNKRATSSNVDGLGKWKLDDH